MKESFEKVVAWGKKNPIILIVLFAGILFVFFRRPAIQEAAATPVIGDQITGQAFPQPFEKTALREPDVLPVLRDDPVPQHHFFEVLVAHPPPPAVHAPPPAVHAPPPAVHAPPPAVHAPPPVVLDRPIGVHADALDYHQVGRVAYRAAIARAHERWQPGLPDRPVRDGLIQTVEHGWQTPAQIKARQKVRYDRARAAGRTEDALKVKRETELAIGQRTGW